jgi:hypothetical protein
MLETALRYARAKSVLHSLANQVDWPLALTYFHQQLRAERDWDQEALECPEDDASLTGAVLAVARHRAALALHGTEHLLHSAQVSCWVAGIREAFWLRAEPYDWASHGGATDPSIAAAPGGTLVDEVSQVCSRGVPGIQDQCWNEEQANPRAGASSERQGVVNVVLTLNRAGGGCGSEGQWVYQVARVGDQSAGEWRVIDEECFPGDHNQCNP